MIYLDYAATAIPYPEVANIFKEAITQITGNPSSQHHFGRKARVKLEQARQEIATCLEVPHQGLVFTSGGSESNNTVFKQFLDSQEPCHVITSQIEHPSILATCQLLEQQPHMTVSYLPVTSKGVVEPDALPSAITPQTRLISIMGVNNELGTIQPIEQLAETAQSFGIPLHTDSVQSLGKCHSHWKNANFASFAAHKIGGPLGISALYFAQEHTGATLITGGKQERARRAGTENVALALGFAYALKQTFENFSQIQRRLKTWNHQIIQSLSEVDEFFLSCPVESCVPHILNFGFHGITAESLLILLDLDKIAISAGSACSSGALEPSTTLLAMGFTKEKAKSALRLSMGWATTQSDVDFFIERTLIHVKKLLSKRKKL